MTNTVAYSKSQPLFTLNQLSFPHSDNSHWHLRTAIVFTIEICESIPRTYGYFLGTSWSLFAIVTLSIFSVRFAQTPRVEGRPVLWDISYNFILMYKISYSEISNYAAYGRCFFGPGVLTFFLALYYCKTKETSFSVPSSSASMFACSLSSIPSPAISLILGLANSIKFRKTKVNSLLG